MPIGSADRVLFGLVAVYFCYRLLSALNTGIYDGGGDPDVHAEDHPTAFVLTIFSSLLVIVVCAFIALGPASTDLAEAVVWLRKTLL
jgi:hypothetical protein